MDGGRLQISLQIRDQFVSCSSMKGTITCGMWYPRDTSFLSSLKCTQVPSRTFSLPPQKAQCIPSFCGIFSMPPSRLGTFHWRQCEHFMTHSAMELCCHSRSIVWSTVLAVPVNFRIPNLDAFRD